MMVFCEHFCMCTPYPNDCVIKGCVNLHTFLVITNVNKIS